MHTAELLVPEATCFEIETDIENSKDINHQVLIIFEHSWSKLEVNYYILRSVDLLILFQIRKNCHSSGRNLLLYLLI